MFHSCATEYRSQESVAPGQDDSDCGCNKEAERRLWTSSKGGSLYPRTPLGRSVLIYTTIPPTHQFVLTIELEHF